MFETLAFCPLFAPFFALKVVDIQLFRYRLSTLLRQAASTFVLAMKKLVKFDLANII